MMSSLLYIVVSVPVGRLMDKTNSYGPESASQICKLVQAGGFYCLALAFAMLGPFELGPLSTKSVFNNIPSGWIAMLLKGVGSSGNNAGYPDLSIGIANDDEPRQVRLAGLWNAAYASGWAAGPLLGSMLFADLGGSSNSTQVRTQVGFSRFATTISLISFAYGSVMLFAAVWMRRATRRTGRSTPFRRFQSIMDPDAQSIDSETQPLLGAKGADRDLDIISDVDEVDEGNLTPPRAFGSSRTASTHAGPAASTGLVIN